MISNSGKHWVTEPHQILEPTLSKKGFGAIPPRTVTQVLLSTVERFGDRPALGVKTFVNGAYSEDWKMWTWKQYLQDCRAFAKTLIHLEIDSFSIINILGFNSPEWFFSCVGAIFAGCICAGIYSTNGPEACQYITGHSKAAVVVLEGNKQLIKYANVPMGSLPQLKAIVVYGEPIDPAVSAKVPFPVHTWEAFLHLGSKVPEEEVDRRSVGLVPGNCASLIYTSGTTGPPKAVMISHDNITWVAANVCRHYMSLNHEDCTISYLPLSHIAAQAVDIFCIMELGGCTYFAQPDALKGSLTKTMKEVRPTFFFGVPRVWEKIQEKMAQIGRESTGIKKHLGTWAKSCGTGHTQMAQYGQSGGAPFGYGCANALILSKIKEALGLDRAKGCYTAAAPISVDTLNYFGSLDIPLYEVFGQSECTGPHTVSSPGNWKIGYCGRPIAGSESMIVPSTGELCYRGRHIFMGYMYMPEKTVEAIDEQGFLHSGDVAEFDDNNQPDFEGPSGFMRITGRIKELIITAGGENIPPVLIENEMKAEMLAISNCMVIGDKRKFLSMMVSLKVDVNLETATPTDKLAPDSLFVGKQIGSSATLYSEAMKDPLWKKYLDDGMKAVNKRTHSNAQVIQKWVWLPEDFSEKAGDLTPTLKLKRSVVAAKYAALIDSIYADEA